MPTKSEVMYQRVLYTKELIKEISIKHYDQARYAEIVDEIFNKVFLCDAVDRVGLEKSVKAQVILCSDSSPCEYQTDEEGEPLADDVSGKESIVIEDDSVRGES